MLSPLDHWAAWVTVRFGFGGFLAFFLLGFLVGIRYERGRRARMTRRLNNWKSVPQREGS
jgi:hypothetical protein